MMTTSVGTRAETQVHEQIDTSSPIDSEWWAGDDYRNAVHELTMMTKSVGTRAETQVHEQINTSSPIDAEWWAVEDGVLG